MVITPAGEQGKLVQLFSTTWRPSRSVHKHEQWTHMGVSKRLSHASLGGDDDGRWVARVASCSWQKFVSSTHFRDRTGQRRRAHVIQCLAPLLKTSCFPFEQNSFILSKPPVLPIVLSFPLLIATPEVKLDSSLPPGMPPLKIITCQCYCTFRHQHQPAFSASREA